MKKRLCDASFAVLAFATLAASPVPALAGTATFDIAPQAISSALGQFGLQSKSAIVFDPKLTAGLQTPGVKGRWDDAEALKHLLANTGLKAVPVHGGFIVKMAVADPDVGAGAGARQQAPSPAAPADPRETAANDDTTIIVTARRMEERLQDVPISITVFNQQQLSNRNVTTAQDLATYTPSLSANSNFGSDNTSFAIRGFVQEIGTAPSVGVYFADVVAPRGASNGVTVGDGAGPGNFFDLENVQVLKGPQGTLFGRNTTGGAILLVPKKPTQRLEGYVEGSIGDYDMRRVQAVINVPVSDTFRFRIGIDRQTRDGYLNNVSGIGPSHLGNVDYIAVRGSMIADLTPNLENYTIVSYSKSDTNGSVQKLIAADPRVGFGALAQAQLARQGSGFYNVMSNAYSPLSLLEQWQIINTTTWTASDTLTVKNIASYAQLKDDLQADLFGTDFLAGPYHLAFSNPGPVPGGHTADQSTFTEELQLQGRSPNDRLTWQAGAYLEASDPLGDAGSLGHFLLSCTGPGLYTCTDVLGAGAYAGALAAGANPATLPPIHVGAINYTTGRTYYHDVGLYGQATYKLNSQLKFTGGIRYTRDHQTNDSVRETYAAAYPPGQGLFPTGPLFPNNPRCTDPTQAPSCAQHTYQASQAPTWLVDLDYTPIHNLLAYAKYARGYRAGTISPNITAQFRIVKPERVDTYELGVKSSFVGAVRGSLNVAAFYNDFRNQQIQVGFNSKTGSGQASTSAPVNAGKSELYGLEVEGSLTPFEGLTLNGGYAYLKTKIKSVPDFSTFSDPNFVLAPAFHVGDPLVLSPKNKFTITGTYVLPLPDAIGRVSFGATFTHSDRSLANYADRTSANPTIAALSWLPATNLLNLNFGWESILGHPVDVAVFATNVTKQKYWVFDGGLGQGAGFDSVVLGQPRMWGVRLKYRFGS